MQLLFAMLIACGWPLLVYRFFGWFRRRKAEHRQRLIAAGYKENNPARRLRGDRYIRISAIAYVGIALIAFSGIYNAFPPMANGFAIVMSSWIISSILAFIPAVFVHVIVMLYGEWTEIAGDVAIEIRDKQFHIPGQPVVPNNERGSTPILDAIKAGLSNPAGLTIPSRRLVEEVAK
jgi:hypothetical protein